MTRKAHALVEAILAQARIPSAKRRRAVGRELLLHLEDSLQGARAAGQSDEESERQAIEGFGDPGEIARYFCRVYRCERAIQRVCVFGLSAAAVAVVTAAATLVLQAGVAAGFGLPFWDRHTLREIFDILATVAVYAAMVALERAFPAWRAWQIVLGGVAGALAGMALHAPFVAFGFASAAFLRMTRGSAVGWGVAPLAFAMLGILFWARLRGAYPLAAGVASWTVAGAAYQAMTHLAARVDRKLWTRLEEG